LQLGPEQHPIQDGDDNEGSADQSSITQKSTHKSTEKMDISSMKTTHEREINKLNHHSTNND